MTAATAYDQCIEAVVKYHRCYLNAVKLGNKKMAARFERKRIQAMRAADKWLQHPALVCKISPSGEVFRISHRNVRITTAPSLREAERKAAEYGFRFLDTLECGVYRF